MSVLSAYVTNLSEYVSGNLRGGWLALPASPEDINRHMEKIGVGPEGEYFISDYECNNYLMDVLGTYENIYDLNVVAALIEKINPNPEKMDAVLKHNSSASLEDIANLIVQEEEIPFSFYEFEGLQNNVEMNPREKYGYTYLKESGQQKELEALGLIDYIDCAAIGRDAELNGLDLYEDGFFDIQLCSVDMQTYNKKELYAMAEIPFYENEIPQKEERQEVSQARAGEEPEVIERKASPPKSLVEQGPVL